MAYLIEHFLRPGAGASAVEEGDELWQRYFRHFSFDHVCNGIIDVIGDDDDRWRMTVHDNIVTWEWEPIITFAHATRATPTGWVE